MPRPRRGRGRSKAEVKEISKISRIAAEAGGRAKSNAAERARVWSKACECIDNVNK